MRNKELLRRTNVYDLLDDGIENGSDLRRLLDSSSASEMANQSRIAHSTTDPFKINFSEANAADAIDSKFLSRSVWRKAWFWYAFPPIVVAVIGTFALVFGSAPYRFHGPGDFLVSGMFATIIIFLVSYWPIILLRRAKRRFSDDT